MLQVEKAIPLWMLQLFKWLNKVSSKLRGMVMLVDMLPQQ